MTLHTASSDAAARKFKKKLGPTHIQPDHVLPVGTFGQTGVTLKPISNKPGLHLVNGAASH